MYKEIIFKKTGFKPLACAAFVCVQMLLSSSFSQNPGGTTGSLTWSFNPNDSTLTINGNDTMPDYNMSGMCTTSPWCNLPIAKVMIEDGVKSIGAHAFDLCINLNSVVIPNSVIAIRMYAFAYCFSLTSVVIPNTVTTIGSNVFENCNNLSSVVIPNTITTIDVSTFYFCTNLTSVIIPNSVTKIETSAFGNCDKLDSIVCFAHTPPALGNKVFDRVGYFPSIRTVYIPCGTLEAYHAADGWKNFTSFQHIGAPYPDSLTVLQQEKALEISWQNTNALNYEIYRNNMLLDITDSCKSNGVNYCYKIRAIYDLCTSMFTSEECKTFTGTAFPSPSYTTVLQQDNAMKINWQGVEDALNYEIYRNNVYLATTASIKYTDATNLIDSTNYCYKVKAIYDLCESDFSPERCERYENTGSKITNNVLNSEKISLYPNPNSGRLTINTEQLTINHIEISDIVGRVLKTYQFNAPVNTVLDVSELAKGVYFVIFHSEGRKIVRKLVKY